MYFNFSFCGSRVLNGYEQINILHHAPGYMSGAFFVSSSAPVRAVAVVGSTVHRSGAVGSVRGSAPLRLCCCWVLWFCCWGCRCWALFWLCGSFCAGVLLVYWVDVFGLLWAVLRAVERPPEGDIHRPEPGEGVA